MTRKQALRCAHRRVARVRGFFVSRYFYGERGSLQATLCWLAYKATEPLLDAIEYADMMTPERTP